MGRAQALIRAGDYAGAEAALAEPVLNGQASAGMRILYFRMLLRQKRGDEAMNSARAAAAAHPRNARLQAQLGMVLLKLDRVAEAREHLDEAVEEFPDDPAILSLHAEACVKSGDTFPARKSIGAALEAVPEDPDYLALKIVILCVGDQLDRAKRQAGDVPEADLIVQFRDVIAAFLRQDREADALGLAASATEILPGSALLRLVHADLLLAANKLREAEAVLDGIDTEKLPQEQALRFYKAKAQTLKASQDREAAIEVYNRVLALAPDDKDALRELYVLHQRLGHDDEMRAVGKRLTDAGSKKLPPSVAAGLEMIAKRSNPLRNAEAKLEWAWSLADKSKWDHADWLKRVEWGRAADQLLRAWWLNAAERSDEIDALIDRPAPGMTDLIPADARGLTVTTHMGPMAGSVRYLQTCGRPWRGFGFRGPDPVVGKAPPMRIAAGDAAAGLRELLTEIRKGTLMGFAQDTPDLDQALGARFLGKRVSVSLLVPRLIHKHKTASLWCQPLWDGGRIRIELARLPDPEPGEGVELFCRRWCEAYLARIATVMRGAPENLNVAQGIWLNVDPRFGARRKAAEEMV